MTPTTFSENQVKNNVQLPEFTLCPYPGNKTYGYPKSELESFKKTYSLSFKMYGKSMISYKNE